ncbi:MAG TPA: CHAT domain-containing protein [Mycobacteriales bacterium]|nr:CHAT domain-containing protein [Mycobacteriales bacterium]
MNRPGPAALAAEAHRLVGVAPRRALRVAQDAARAAQAVGDRAVEAQALRARGCALRELGRLDEGLAALRQAIRRAEDGGAALVASEARMSLAYLLLERGRTRQAITQADRAAAGLQGLPAAHVLMQRGLLHQQCGQTAEALDCYRRVLPVLRRAGDELHEARVMNNRGVLFLHAGRLAEAEGELVRATRLYAGLGQDLMAASSEWNRGLVAARRGDIPYALRCLDAAGATFDRLGKCEPDLLVGRSELLLSASLRHEARQTAERAVAELTAAGRSARLAEALLLAAQAALASGDTRTAASEADQAARLAVRQKRPGWAALARYVGLRAEERAGQRTPSLRRRALRAARELAAAGWRAQELDARLIAARVALERGDRVTARRELASAARARSTGPLELRIRAWYAEALRRHADGDRRGTERALQSGMRVLDQHRGMLGATELRAHLAQHGRDVAALGMSLALHAGSATKLLQWAERWRARALWNPIRPPQDTELAEALAELRRISSELESGLLAGVGGSAPARGWAGRLQSQKAALEEQVRRLAQKATGSLYTSPSEPPTVAALAAELDGRVLVEIVRPEDSLRAVTIRDGVARLHRLGDLRQVRRDMQSLLFALRRLALGHGSQGSLASARTAAEQAAVRLDAELFGPLADVLGDRPVVLVPPAELQALPWSVLPSCRQREVSVAPSAAMWLRAIRADDGHGGQILLAAGPGLAAAADEVAGLTAAYDKAVELTGTDATVDAVLRGLDGAAVAHIAAHARLRSDNPLFSALDLADGPLTVYHLEQLGQAPRLVLLPACQSGVGQVLAGDEVMGLTAALFALGTRTIVATVIPVPDQATRPMMLALHDGLRCGLPPAQALVHARAATDPDDPWQFATAAGFVCFGAG